MAQEVAVVKPEAPKTGKTHVELEGEAGATRATGQTSATTSERDQLPIYQIHQLPLYHPLLVLAVEAALVDA